MGVRALWIACAVAGMAAGRTAVLPAEPDGTPRQGAWKPGAEVGVPGGMRLERSHLVDVTRPPYNADPTGRADCHAAIEAAINAARPGDVIFLPAGTYLLTLPIRPRDDKGQYTLRGTGEGTLLRWVGKARDCLHLGSESDYSWAYPPPAGIAVTQDVPARSRVLPVDSSAGVYDGGLIQIREDNDPTLPVLHVSGFYAVRRQLQLVVAHSRHSVTVFPGLIWPLKRELHPVVHVARREASGIGVEDLRIDAADSTGGSFIIYAEQCYGCWIYNVHTLHARNYHIWLQDCLHCEIAHSYLDTLNHAGSNGAGLGFNGACACLVQNNIITHSFPNIELNGGASGNVFAYNFCYDSNAYGASGASIDACHAPHPSYNLFEGNAAPVFQADSYFGSSSENTIFRNWWYSRQPTDRVMSRQPVLIDRFCRYYTVAGNLLGTAGHPYYNNLPAAVLTNAGPYGIGLPNMGNPYISGSVDPSRGHVWADLGLRGVVVAPQVVKLLSGPGDLHENMAPISLTWGIDNISSGGTIMSFTSNQFSFRSPSRVQPPVGTAVSIWPGPTGFQEFDRDVRKTIVIESNFDVEGIPTAHPRVPPGPPAADTILTRGRLPSSLYLADRPAWFGAATVWPPFRAESPDPKILGGALAPDGFAAGFDDIPAGYRFNHGGVDPDGVSLFTCQPASQSARAGTQVVFAVATEASPKLHWQTSTDGGRDWADLADSDIYSGAGGATLRVLATPATNGRAYRCVATTADSRRMSFTQPAFLTIRPRRSAAHSGAPPGNGASVAAHPPDPGKRC